MIRITHPFRKVREKDGAPGNSIRSISRMTDVDRNTIASLLLRTGDRCAEIMDASMRNLRCQYVQADEAPELDHADADATIHAPDERFLEEVAALEGGLRFALRAL